MADNNDSTGISLEALMSMTLGELPELNALPPEGTYSCKLKFVTKKINGVNSIEAEFKIVECIEQDNPEAKPPGKDAKFNQLFKTDNDISLGRFRKLAETIKSACGDDVPQIISGGNVYDVLVKLMHRKSKDGDVYANVTKMDLI